MCQSHQSDRPRRRLPTRTVLLRVTSAFSTFAALLVAFAPIHAVAQQVDDRDVSVRDRSRPEYDPQGLRFGGFTLDASVALGVGWTDNVLAAETNEQSDTIYALEPQARLTSNWSRHEAVFEAGGRAESHSDLSSEDVDTYFGRAAGRLDIGSRTTVRASVLAAHDEEPRTVTDAPIGGAPVEFNRTDGSLSLSHNFNRVTLTGTLAARDRDYETTQNFRDNTTSAATGRADIQLSPRFGAVLIATADQREYDNTPLLDSDGYTVLAGLSLGLTNLLRGEVTLGQFSRDYDSGASTEGLAVAANVDWFVTGLTTINVSARQNAEEVIGAVAIPYTNRQFGARVDHELFRNVILTAGADVGRREYDTIDRDDDYVAADVGFDYFLNPRVALRGRYQFERLESEGVNRFRDFEANAATLGVAFRL